MNSIEEVLGIDEFIKVINENPLTLVDFYASWCTPCKMQTPILKEFQETMERKVKLIKVDVDQNPDIANKYKVQVLPTIMLFQNGNEKERAVGLTAKSTLSELLIKYL